MKYNLNDQIRFRPTEFGLKHFKKYYLSYNIDIDVNDHLNENGMFTMCVWEFASIFGSELFMGNTNQCVEDNTFTFVKDDLLYV